MNDAKVKEVLDAVMVVLITAADDGLDGLGVRTEVEAIVRPICEAAGRAEGLSIRLEYVEQHFKEAQVRALKRALKQPAAPPTDPPLWALDLATKVHESITSEPEDVVEWARKLVKLTKNNEPEEGTDGTE